MELNRVCSVFSVPSKQLPTVDSDSPKAHLLLTQLKILLESVLDPGLSPFPVGPTGVLLVYTGPEFQPLLFLHSMSMFRDLWFLTAMSLHFVLFYFRKLPPLSVPFFPAPYPLFVRPSLQDLLEC